MRDDTTQISEDYKYSMFREGTFIIQGHDGGEKKKETKKVVRIPLDISRKTLLSRGETEFVI